MMDAQCCVSLPFKYVCTVYELNIMVNTLYVCIYIIQCAILQYHMHTNCVLNACTYVATHM